MDMNDRPPRPADGNLNGWAAYLTELQSSGAPAELVSEAQGVVKTLSDRIAAEACALVLSGKIPKLKPGTGPDRTVFFFREPDLFDAVGWRERLDWLRAEPEFQGREVMIGDVEAHLAIIERPVSPEPGDTQSAAIGPHPEAG